MTHIHKQIKNAIKHFFRFLVISKKCERESFVTCSCRINYYPEIFTTYFRKKYHDYKLFEGALFHIEVYHTWNEK